MGINRNALRKQAKKAYTEQFSKVPKKNRVPFSQFFKQFKDLKSGDSGNKDVVIDEEDFDFESMINTEDQE